MNKHITSSLKYMQITAGRGPVECARVVTLVARKFLDYCRDNSLTDILEIEVMDSEPHNSAPDCYMSMTFSIKGNIPDSLVKDWEGSIQWVATNNPYRPGHKRKNWFVGIRFFDRLDLPEINESDISYDTCRSGGKGGQNVNKVETTVRATHIPSGITVRCSDERSQAQNKVRARERLLLRLHLLNSNALSDSQIERWKSHDMLERGNPTKKFQGSL